MMDDLASRLSRKLSLPPLTLMGWLRYDVVARELAKLNKAETILEVGAGMGALGARLAVRHSYIGVEPDAQSAAVAMRRVARNGNGRVLRGDVTALPLGSVADLVCAFEVLEHIEDDAAALRQWRERVRRGGWLMISVPAGSDRYGPSDAKVGHFRRYDHGDLAALLRRTGFGDERLIKYGFPLGNLLHAIWNFLAGRSRASQSVAARTSASGRWLQPPEVLGIAWEIGSLPFRLAQRPFTQLGLGTGFVAVARRVEEID
jgi:SAM-dependent methyltransferase